MEGLQQPHAPGQDVGEAVGEKWKTSTEMRCKDGVNRALGQERKEGRVKLRVLTSPEDASGASPLRGSSGEGLAWWRAVGATLRGVAEVSTGKLGSVGKGLRCNSGVQEYTLGCKQG